MTLISEDEVTEVWSGLETIVSNSLKVLSGLKHSYDLCTDSTGPMSIINVEPMRAAYLALKARGIKIRFITEVTPGNIEQSRRVMEFAELRHMDNITGNFVVADSTDYAGSSDVDRATGEIKKLVVSNVGPLVRLQQYFFETLWARAIPAAKRIKQIEDGTQPEVTEIWYGTDSILSRAVNLLQSVKKGCDTYLDRNGPFLVCSHAEVFKTYCEIHARGGKVRMITDITSDNVQYCKRLSEIMEIRHIENVQGNFRILDSKIYGAMSHFEVSDNFSYLHSTVGSFVELQQYFFNTLWDNAKPSSARIAEIVQGKTPGRIQVIHDNQEASELGFKILQRTKHELLVLFSNSTVLSVAVELGAIAIYHQLSQRGVNVRLLVPRGPQTEGVLSSIKSIAPFIETRASNENLSLQLTILISDRNELVTWETREEDMADLAKGSGISTYTNIETLSRSYAIIFDNLWKSTEYADKLQSSNQDLAKKEQALQEFMDMAAHELRTPIQPVLGLSEQLQSDLHQLDSKHKEYLEVIVRNAKRLQKLQEDILDVTKIDSRMIKLHKEPLDLRELLNEAAVNFRGETTAKGLLLKINCKAGLFIVGDREKLLQVITNMLSNAIKATEPVREYPRKGGGKVVHEPEHNVISVTAETRHTSEKRHDEFVSIMFVDHGRGIDSDLMPRLFTKFATNSRTGTGLGLYISKALVEAHGGRIWAENNPGGKGATFHILLPLTNKELSK